MKISCIAVAQETRGPLLKRAIRSFLRQTHQDKELIIVTEGSWWPDIPKTIAKRVVVTYSQDDGLVLGDLRNIGIARADCDVVAQWDDDDVSHPERLRLMAELLQSNPTADAAVLERLTFAWEDKERYWISHRSRWECSMLANRYKIPIYPALKRGEDTPVARAMKIVKMDAPHLYLRTVHSLNTWGATHFDGFWDRRDKIIEGSNLETVKAALAL